MFMFAGRIGLAIIMAALCLVGGAAQAQATGPVSYWLPNWPLGFGGSLAAGANSNTYGNFPSFDGTDARSGDFSYARYNIGKGFFVGSERAGMSFSQNPAFSSLTSEGMQFGYNLQNSPVTLFGGFDTLKYNSGFGGALNGFAPVSGTAGYAAHAGVEFRPASNFSLSLGMNYTQTSGRLDSDSSLPSLSGASQFDLVGGRH
jgi:opacity protein-like surface antigen